MPVPVPDRPHQPRPHQGAAIGDGADGRGHLQRRHADLVAHRNRRQRAVVELIPDDARLLAWQVGRQAGAKAEPAHVALHLLGTQRKPALIAPTLLD